MAHPTSVKRPRRHLTHVVAVAVLVTAAAFPEVAAAAATATVIVNFAGSPQGTAGHSGDGGPATSATLASPKGVAVDPAGNVYIADLLGQRVREVSTSGTIVDFAGSAVGTVGNTGDGGPATSALLHDPVGLAVDTGGNVYIADDGNHRVRKVDTAHNITNFAGSPAGTAGNTGDGGPATSALLQDPGGLAVDSAGDVYIADATNNRVRKVDTGGIVTNFAGSPAGTSGTAGDGGPATSATIGAPLGVATDSAGNVFIADQGSNRVRKVDTGGIITNFAGSAAGTSGHSGDGGAATSAFLADPRGLTTDPAGNVYIADQFNNRIRKVDTGGIISNFAGSAVGTGGNSGDGGLATSALLNLPEWVALDPAGRVLISDWLNNRVREVVPPTAPAITSAAAASFSVGLTGSFAVTTTGLPLPAVAETGTLPSGVTFDSATHTLGGTPARGTVGSYPITFQATNGVGSAAIQPFTLVVTRPPGYTALLPVRICDTRAAGPGVVANQCDTHGHNPLSTGSVLNVTVTGVGGVPADAIGVVLHVTATAAAAASYLTVWPTGQPQPTAANLNWLPGQTVANLVQTGVGTGGQVSVFNYAFATDVVIDLQGFVRAGTGALFVPLAPTRVCDTRLGQPVNQCNQGGNGPLSPGATAKVNVQSGFGVPVGATAVVLNVTATTTSTASYMTVWPDGNARPLASSLNWAPGQTVSNRVVTAISPAGVVDVFNAYGSADVVIDLGGYFAASPTGSGYFPVAPFRICDTRPVGPGVASNPCNVQGPGTVPADTGFSLSGFNPAMTAVVVNVTVTNTAAAGFLTVFPDDSAVVPLAADVTWPANQTIGNLVVADLGSTSTMAVFNGSAGSTDVIIDIVGFYSPGPLPGAARPMANIGTRFTATSASRAPK